MYTKTLTFVVFLNVFILAVNAWAPTSVPSCPRGKAPKCPDNPVDDYDNLFSHPNDCNYFIHCDAGAQPICKQCPAGLHFNPELHVCDWPYRAGCKISDEENSFYRAEEQDKCPEKPEEICPDCDCEGERHPHPSECEWYYECKNGVPTPEHCGDGLHFNPSIGICDYPCYAGCEEQVPPVTKPQPPPKPTTTKPVTPKPTDPPPSGDCPSTNNLPVPNCPFPDPELSVFFPHPTDCHWFFHCSNGIAYCKECPADLHWNVELNTCDYPYKAGCEDKVQSQLF